MNERHSFTPASAWRAGEEIMAAEWAEAVQHGYSHEDRYGTPDPHRGLDAMRDAVDFDDVPELSQ